MKYISFRQLIICRFSSLLLLSIISYAMMSCQQDLRTEPWLDQSPHKTGFIPINDNTIHYLDWGGKGDVLLFLSGIGGSAHTFDDFAPLFIDQFRVLGMTRRGHGQSDMPPSGYDLETLVKDIHAFLDSMQIETVTLVGHSYAGGEMTKFAELYPDRLKRLIYLDAAFDYEDYYTILSKFPMHYFVPDSVDQTTRTKLIEFYSQAYGYRSAPIINDFHATSRLMPDGRVNSTTHDSISGIMMNNLVNNRPGFSKIKAPTLAIYAFSGVLYPNGPVDAKEACENALVEVSDPWARKNMELFRSQVPNAVIVEMPNTQHGIYLHKPDIVEEHMRAFLNAHR